MLERILQVYRILFFVRTPSTAFFWQGSRGIYSKWKIDWSIQNPAHYRYVFQAFAGPGKIDPPSGRSVAGCVESNRWCSRHGRPAHVHADAGSGETK